LHFLIVNIEALQREKGDAHKVAKAFLTSHRTLMVVDESTTIRIPKSQQTINVLKLGGLAAYRRNLSGLPDPEGAIDLYTQCLHLRTPKFPFTSYYTFRNQFCTLMKVKTNRWKTRKFLNGTTARVRVEVDTITGSRNLKRLHAVISKFSSIIHKSECLDLPAKTYERRLVALTEQQTELYRQMKRFAMVELDGKLCTTQNALGQMQKLHQIACGNLHMDDDTWIALLTNRIAELQAQLDETRGKVVIWCTYVKDIERVAKHLTARYGESAVATFYGETDQDLRPEIIKAYEDQDSLLRFLVANPATGKYSWTLVAGNTAIYYSNGYKLEDRHQSEDRLHRIGQRHAVTYIDLEADGTVDSDIIQSLKDKRNIAAEIMGPAWRAALYQE
jgi:SNF2 family DNA or RNA helicase